MMVFWSTLFSANSRISLQFLTNMYLGAERDLFAISPLGLAWARCRSALVAKTSRSVVRMSASLIGRLESSAFRLILHGSVDIAHGLALLFGIGTKALPAWGSRTKWNNLWGGLAGRQTLAGPSGHTISLHPSSREGHHSTAWWSSSFLLSHWF